MSLAEFGGGAAKGLAALLLLPTVFCVLVSLIYPFEAAALLALAEASAPATRALMQFVAEGDRATTLPPARLAADDLVISFCLVALLVQAVAFAALTAAYRRHIAGWIAFKFELGIDEWFWRGARQWLFCAVIALAAVLDLAFGGYLMLFFEDHVDGGLVSFQVTLLRVCGFSFVMSGLVFVSLYHLLYFVFAKLARLERAAEQ